MEYVSMSSHAKRHATHVVLIVAGFGGLAAETAHASVTFEFTPTGNSQVDAGLVKAGQLWSNVLADNITVRVTTSYKPGGSAALASTAVSAATTEYSTIKAKLLGHATSANDVLAYSHLPNGNYHSFYINGRDGTRFLDNDYSVDNRTLSMSWCQAKVLGLDLPDAQDGVIAFNSNYSYDFDRSDGINAVQYDFVGVAIHELGHVLGFTSSVDAVDYYSGPNGPSKDWDPDTNTPGLQMVDSPFTVLDMFRYKAESGGSRDFTYGGTPYFSIDGGVTDLGHFSTGQYNGNGFQAGHWRNFQELGAMDPTIGTGELVTISPLDVLAMDVVGYTVVPEPSMTMVLGASSVLLCVRRRRRE